MTNDQRRNTYTCTSSFVVGRSSVAMHALDIENLHKSFDGLPVLRGLHLQVPTGQMYGLVGQAGAGKSTLINLLLGFLKPYKGVVRVLGTSDPARVRGRVGYLPQRVRFHERFTGREYLRALGQFDDVRGAVLKERVERELRVVGLGAAAGRLISSYSRGMRQRLGLAQALLHDPHLLIIDEPLAGLDVPTQRELFALISGLRERGVTVFITTGFVSEIEFLCDRVGVLHGGKIAADLDVATLRAPGRDVTITVDALPAALAAKLAATSEAVRCEGHTVTIRPNNPALQARVLRTLLDADATILALEAQRRPFEELFTRIVRGEQGDLARQEPVTQSNGLFAPPNHPDALLSQLLNQDERTDT